MLTLFAHWLILVFFKNCSLSNSSPTCIKMEVARWSRWSLIKWMVMVMQVELHASVEAGGRLITIIIRQQFWKMWFSFGLLILRLRAAPARATGSQPLGRTRPRCAHSRSYRCVERTPNGSPQLSEVARPFRTFFVSFIPQWVNN